MVNLVDGKTSNYTANDKEVVVRMVDGRYQITIPQSINFIFFKLILKT
jgi:hypothetical protein